MTSGFPRNPETPKNSEGTSNNHSIVIEILQQSFVLLRQEILIKKNLQKSFFPCFISEFAQLKNLIWYHEGWCLQGLLLWTQVCWFSSIFMVVITI